MLPSGSKIDYARSLWINEGSFRRHSRVSKAMLAIVMVGAMAAGGVAQESPQDEAQKKQKAELVVRITMNYLLYLPEDYDQKESWPLILFLHGAGERGDDLELVKVHGPPKLIANGQKFPFIVVSPQCPEALSWDPEKLTALLDTIVEKYKVDTDRIYVTGLSMGGFGTWSLAMHTPDRFAAIAPICGGGESRYADRIVGLPIWAFHGDKDEAVPIKRSQDIVNAVQKAGGNVEFTVYPGVGHDSWTETYDNPKLYEWFLSHTRKK